jgi:hypothetical protein
MVGISAGTPAAYRPRVRLPSGPRGFSTVWMGGGCCAWSPYERPITWRPVWTPVDKLSRLSTAPTLLPHDSPQRTWMARGFSTAIPSRPTDVSTTPAMLSARHPWTSHRGHDLSTRLSTALWEEREFVFQGCGGRLMHTGGHLSTHFGGLSTIASVCC